MGEGKVSAPAIDGIRAIWFHENGDDRPTGEMHRTIHDLRELPQALELLG